MRLSKIKIKNFRSFKDETITFDKYTCVVGPNGSGKSTIFQALNIFFRNRSGTPLNIFSLSNEDFHHRNTKVPIEITLTFEELSSEAQEDLKAYYRSGKLIVTAIAKWNEATGVADVKQYGSRLVMEDFKSFFNANLQGERVPVLKGIYVEIRKKFPNLAPPSTKTAMEKELRKYEETHPERCELIPEENQFYGWAKGQDRIKKYLQWIYVPSVKDASTEQDEGRNTAIGQLLERTVRTKVNFKEPIDKLKKSVYERYEKIIEEEQHILDSLSNSLTKRIQEWTHAGTKIQLKWQCNQDKSLVINEPLAKLTVGEHDFMGEIARLGHGLQRTAIVSLLQELAESDQQSDSTLLLGFEEPELYQHPPQARHMAILLEELSKKNSQILLNTHSPHFVPSAGFENIRMTRKSGESNSTVVSRATYEEISKIIAEALGEKPKAPKTILADIAQIIQPTQRELYFANIVILVEGIEDVAYLSTHLKLSGRWIDFRKYGCHFVVCAGKTNISRLLAVAKSLDIPAFVVFDADTDASEDDLRKHSRDNKCLLELCEIKDVNPLPEKTLYFENAVVWQTNIGNIVRDGFGVSEWESARNKAKDISGFTEGVNKKNVLLIAATLDELFDNEKSSESLDIACTNIIEFAKNH